MAGPVIASIVSMSNGPCSQACSTLNSPYRPMWLAMKFGESLATTTLRPSRTSSQCLARAMVSSLVAATGMTSTSGM